MTDNTSIPISRPRLGEKELENLRQVLDSGWLTQGPKVAEFEAAFAARHNVDHAVAVTSCTTGLHLALVAMGIGPGDEVVVPAFTWVASANAVLHSGATPIFADVDPLTFNISVERMAEKITDKTRAVMPVHLFGLCADIDGIRAALPDGIRIVEDAACAAGGEYKGNPAGGLGKAAVFSFHPRKSITTGEGGMITTNDKDLAESLRRLRNHGASVSEEERHAGPRPHLLPEFPVLGYNYRMTDLQGAVGLAQLDRLDGFLEERAGLAEAYRKDLADVDWLRLPGEPEEGRHAWQAFVAYVEPGKSPVPVIEIMDRLQAAGVASRPGTHAVPMLEYYRRCFGFEPEDFPAARDCAANSLALPLHNCMNEDDRSHIVAQLKAL
jgi:dTDP-4-amino-4,6-dideoxygalactose transaminase